jgi:serine/threonine-protein kinase
VSDSYPPAAGEFPAGSNVAGYRLDEVIGRGGMAVVYRAFDSRLQRRVALKVLAPELVRDEEFRLRFIRESRAAAAVDHPNVLPIFEAGEGDGVLFIAMRYVQGGDVRNLIDEAGIVPVARACAIIAQVATALDVAHAHGLVHRDVKPANMLRDATAYAGQPDHVYLSDFGLSKRSVGSGNLTSRGHFLGTLNYVAPEQIEGRNVDGRADLYALACSAFEMLSGQPPFRRDDNMAIMWAQVNAAPPLLARQNPALPKAVNDVMNRALAKQPGDRYVTCLDFAAALGSACGLRTAQAQLARPARGAKGGFAQLGLGKRGQSRRGPGRSGPRPVPEVAAPGGGPAQGGAAQGGPAQPAAPGQGPTRNDAAAPDLTELHRDRTRSGPASPRQPSAGPAVGEQAQGQQAQGQQGPREQVRPDHEKTDPGVSLPWRGDPQRSDPHRSDPQRGDPGGGDPRRSDPSGDPWRSDPADGGLGAVGLGAAAQRGPAGGAGQASLPIGTPPGRRPPRQPGSPPPRRPWVARKSGATVVAACVAVLGATGGYLLLGKPSHPGHPQGQPTVHSSTGTGTGQPQTQRAVALPGCTEKAATAPTVKTLPSHAVDVGRVPFDVVLDGHHPYGFVSTGKGITVLKTARPAPSVLGTVPLKGAQDEALTPDSKYLVVAAGSGMTVYQTAALEHGPAHSVGSLTVHGGIHAVEVALSPDGKFAFVSLQESLQVAVFNLQRALSRGFGPADVVGTVRMPKDPVGLTVSPDGNSLYVATGLARPATTSGAGFLSVVPLHQAETKPSAAVVKNVKAGCGPDRMAVSPDGKYLWVSVGGGNAILAYTTASLATQLQPAPVAKVATGELPLGLVFANGGATLVVADSNRDQLASAAANLALVDVKKALAGQPGALTGLIKTGVTPRQFALEPDGSTLLVTNTESGQVQAVDLTHLP